MLMPSAARTMEAIGPAILLLEQLALGLRALQLLELRQRKAFLDRIRLRATQTGTRIPACVA
jgi:hypothetical protein